MDTNELELSVFPEELCRTCLAAVDRTQLKPIFCNEILDGRIVPFPKVVELTVGEQLVKHEKLPSNVCMECKAKMRELYIFVEKVRKSSNLLYEIFSVDKPVPSQIVRKQPNTKTTEVQTDFIYMENESSPPPAVMVENGTQSDWKMPIFSEASCQTDSFTEMQKVGSQSNIAKSTTAVLTTVEQVSPLTEPVIESIKDNIITDDETTLENEVEMILVAEDPTEEECLSLSTIALNKKRSKRSQMKKPLKPVVNMSKNSTSKNQQHTQYCEYCNLNYHSASFAQHIAVHRKTLELCLESIDYYRCPICFVVFISQQQFDDHFTADCAPVQPEEFSEHSDVNRHELLYGKGLDVCVPKLKTFKLSVEDLRYRCIRCPQRTECFEEMRSHVQVHDVEDDGVENVDSLWKENNLDKVHVCGMCQAQFPDALYIRQHLYFHQATFFCPYDCPMSCDKFLNLTKHIQRIHLQKIKGTTLADELPDAKPGTMPDEIPVKFSCSQCGRIFPDLDALEMHVAKHYRERKFVCSVCKKHFAQKSDLTTHERIHTNERPYPCEVCGKSFRTTSHRRDHMSTHEVVNKYECDVCQKLFKAERILIGHKRLHTGEKPFSCMVCLKSFSRKHHLKLHLKVHGDSAEARAALK
ncbi:zinc finger protein 543-like [Anopheles ziemanni]|uniref:zinc finger protein 543-like n=1 Tax=Anopheles coustani TaxID=139045 RepID=UPI002659F657|nr:zinc finger protein 543-like [Anopheles coustani]XP_058171942.1 zinc finger protein 543-like [Anopheles ziemanni]